MSTVWITVQFAHMGDNLGPQRVQMDVADEFLQIEIFLAQYGFEAVLKQGAVATVPVIEMDHISRQQPSHEGGKSRVPRSQKKMGVIGQKGPGQAGGTGFWKKKGHPLDQIVPVPVVPEYFSTLDTPDDDMLKHPGRVYSGCSRHGPAQ